jgi:hypothetical protein
VAPLVAEITLPRFIVVMVGTITPEAAWATVAVAMQNAASKPPKLCRARWIIPMTLAGKRPRKG